MTKFDRVLSKEEAELVSESVGFWYGSEDEFQELAEALEQAVLAKLAEQGPVAWRVHPFDYGIGVEGAFAISQHPEMKSAWENKGWKPEPLYTHPMPSKPYSIDKDEAGIREQEPIVYLYEDEAYGASSGDISDYIRANGTPLYAHPIHCISPTSDKTACVSENGESETQHHIEYIKRYQNWRRGEDKTMGEAGITPKQLGESLDWLIAFAENHIVDNNKMVGNTQKTTLKQGE